ncbi:MAG: VWA domain-containing protein [Methylococcales symbiont of Iophon sp. n. MRB-2018]|nr:MAG: VWA domain-containing protein [Methylococcales symbiont of Iophon sp. n. MRB-2018]KAF3979022.1 MAG: VWA domain-containing protein [Methylococcales symbiont of Iophon sp. n. MRB-2018]
MNIADFHFIRPYWLLALLPATYFFISLVNHKLNRGSWSLVCDPELAPFVLQDRVVKRSLLSLTVTSLAIFLATFLLIISLAGPAWERIPSPVFRNDAALVIALDLSRSMDAADVTPSRLSRARFKVADILKQRKDGQTALIVYAADAFIVTPLTEDNETIISQISALTTDIVPSQGSNTKLAIEKAVELLKQSGLQKGDILLVTDAVDLDNTVDAVQALDAYRLSILAVGTKEGAPIKNRRGGFVKDGAGNIVVPRLNEQELSQLANKGNGLYLKISNDDSDINALMEHFDNTMETEYGGSKNNNLFLNQWDEKGPWLLMLVLPLAALGFRRGLLSFALLCLMPFPETVYALEWKDLWHTQNQQAELAFKQGNFQQAAEQYDNPLWKATAQYKAGQIEQSIETLQDDESANGLYNKGNALAQTGKLLEALDAYQKSLAIEPEDEDAIYNKEQVEKAIKIQKQQQKDQQNSDSDPSEKDQSEQQESEQNKDEQGDKSKQSDNAEQNEDAENSEQSADQEQVDKDTDAEQEKAEKTEDEQQAEQGQPQGKEEKPNSSDYDESEQANEQWLKSIPDDPAGLLKRKFKYQYGQRDQKNTNQKNW